MDDAMPPAGAFLFFNTGISAVPTPAHSLGIRLGGDGGTTPALAVVITAIVDALHAFGVRHVEMAATPERTWRARHNLPQRPHTLEREG
jgi:aerobic carbon-monoxide dehydrogenase large subunit